VWATTGVDGKAKGRAHYRPYGTQFNSTLGQSKGFIGEKHDPETGLMYLNARYYDPVLTRFISPDDWDPTVPGVGTNRLSVVRVFGTKGGLN
jgi:RHS repeat-associated protein